MSYLYALLIVSLSFSAQASKIENHSVPKNLGAAISKNNAEFVEKYLKEGQSPNQVSDWGFGSPYLIKALENVEKYENKKEELEKSRQIVALMVKYDEHKDARNEALLYSVRGESYHWMAGLLEMGADINYYICQNLGFGIGKKTPWTILDFAASRFSHSSIENLRYTNMAVNFIVKKGGISGREMPTGLCVNH